MRRFVSSLLTVAGLALLPAGLRAQQTGTVTGLVTGQGNVPVPNAAVQIVGTTMGTRTSDDGSYRITGVPSGARTLRASRIGYAAMTQSVTVPAGGTVSANFTLDVSHIVLGDVLITAASGETMRKRESGAATATVAFDSVPPVPSANFSQALNCKASGVTIQQASGSTGSGARIRIRGSNSMSLSNEPLLIIDGVRADNSAESNSIDVGGIYPSRINDLNPDDIESVEVIKGPAAAALYGTAAANGVLQITTKRGRAGQTHFTTYGERGRLYEVTAYPYNFGGWTSDTANYPPVIGSPGASPFCNLDEQAHGGCTIDSLAKLNPLEQYSPFRIGNRSKFGGSVNGGSDKLQYYLSGDKEVEEGVLMNNLLARFNLRSNLRASLRKDLDVSLNTGYTNSALQLPQTDNSYYAPLGNGYGGDAYPGLYHGYDPIPPEQSYSVNTTQNLDRFVGSLNTNYTPLPWLKVTGVTGADILSRIDREITPRDAVHFTDASLLGAATSNQFRITNYTANFSGIATFQPAEALTSTTTVGSQFAQSSNTGTFAYGEDLAGGIASLRGVAARFAVDERTITNRTLGGIFSEELGWRDRLFLTGAARADKNSAFGANLKPVVYPAASISYVVSEEPYWPRNPVVSTLRLRTAYGESGLRPGPQDALQYYAPRGTTVHGKDAPGLALANFDNPNLRPERSGELEGGFEASLFGDRASLDVTAYDKRSRDALVLRRLPPSLGGPTSRFENIGKVSNKGLEVALNSKVLQLNNLQWDVNVNAAWNRNRLVELGKNIPDIVFGFSSSQRHTPGRPLGAFYGRVITGYQVVNGLVDPSTIKRSASPTYLGTPIPTRTVTLTTGVTFFKLARLSTLLDYKGGHMQYNDSESFRCGIGTCRGVNDPAAPADEQARALARYESSSAIGDFIEHADYMKVREVSLTLTAPHDWAALARANDASLVISGRNLYTWTRYTGLDPEQNIGQNNFTTTDFLGQPNVRYATVRLNLTF
ncbi:MAG: SusC/RagA family TonB-linked outer membrane protein [Gemmatimonadaceae bacterium]|nr:SusC/RagA family TonB-linked outer membrane protein [Gemmatimonadaceae bacterium]